MTSTGLSVPIHVSRKEAFVSYAALGQTQAECLKIDLFSSFFCLSGATQMGSHFAQERCVLVNDALAAILTLYCWDIEPPSRHFLNKNITGVSCVMLRFGDKHVGFFQQKRHNQLCTPDSIFYTVCAPLCMQHYVTRWWGNTSLTSPPLHNQLLSGG